MDVPPPPALPAALTGVGALLRRAAGSRPSGGSGGVLRRLRAPMEGEEAGGGGELHSVAEEAGEVWGERKREWEGGGEGRR